jgi:hypothetical protein
MNEGHLVTSDSVSVRLRTKRAARACYRFMRGGSSHAWVALVPRETAARDLLEEAERLVLDSGPVR